MNRSPSYDTPFYFFALAVYLVRKYTQYTCIGGNMLANVEKGCKGVVVGGWWGCL